jgi:RNA polymerase sigma-32 factor
MIQTDWEECATLLKRIQPMPHLTSVEELELVKEWQQKQNSKALSRILQSHLKLVAKIARGYRGYGLSISDLVSEGNIGMLQAMKHYDLNRGFRFSTYAQWWVRAQMQHYILSNWSLVKIGTTEAQKKLFFNLNKIKSQLGITSEDSLSQEQKQTIAKELVVTPQEISDMEERLGKDYSLNQTISGNVELETEWIEWLQDEQENPEQYVVKLDEMRQRKAIVSKALNCLNSRELTIFQNRRLRMPPLTLKKTAQNLGISAERVRQIERDAFFKIQKEIQRFVPHHPHYV